VKKFIFVAALFTSLVFLQAKEHSTTPQVVTLERAYDIALATDQSIRIAYEEVRKANLLPWSALTRLGPQLTAGANFGRSGTTVSRPVTVVTDQISGSGSTKTALQSFNSHSGSATGSISFSQPLIDLTVFPAYRLGKLSARVARLQHRFTIRGTLFGVVTAYYEVLKEQRLVIVNQQALELGKEQLNLAQIRANVGEVTRADVLRAQVVVQTAEQTLVDSQNTLLLDRNTLGNILNFRPDTKFEVAEPPDYPTSVPSFAVLLEKAYDHREDLLAKTLAVDQDIERKNEVIGEYGPRVVAEASGDIANDTGSSRSKSQIWSADISIQVPILTGGQREIDLLTAQRQITESKLQREQQMKTVEGDVKQGWLAVQTLSETLKASKVQVEAAEQSYQDLQVQYKAGAATSVDVLSALNDLNAARKNLAIQTYDYQVALRNIEQATGVFQETRVQKTKVR